MSNQYHRIVVESGPDKTSIEKDIEMLRQLEITMKTGPIIGEAREVIIHLSRNIMIRDLLLDSMGVGPQQREHLFGVITTSLNQRDDEILAKRKSQ